MKFKIFILCVVPLLFGCSATERYKGLLVYEKEFRVSGGRSVKVPVTDLGPVPAENSEFRVENANLIIGSQDKTPDIPEIFWIFEVVIKKNISLKKVVIKRVGPPDNEIQMINDENPQIKAVKWVGIGARTFIDDKDNEWVLQKEQSIFIFEFKLIYNLNEESILYQTVLIPEEAKTKYRKVINKIQQE